jgi:hypothetical protein
MRHYRSGSITVTADVDVDVGDVLDELDDDDLIEELRRRRKEVPPAFEERFIEYLRDAIRRRDWRDAETWLEVIAPECPRRDSIEAAYAEWKKNASANL